MTSKKFSPFFALLLSILVACIFCIFLFSPLARASNERNVRIPHFLRGLSTSVLNYAINGYEWALAHHGVKNPDVLTIVDFTKPSFEKRMWVIDIHSGKVLMKLHVAQGRNSGAIYPTRFSNRPGSLESSLGIFTTEDKYQGEHGESMRIDGLEPGINDKALSRAIVVHAASYVTPEFIKENGYAGRSWGCLAVNPAHLDKLIKITHGGSVIFVYAKPEARDPRVVRG